MRIPEQPVCNHNAYGNDSADGNYPVWERGMDK